MDRGIGDKYFHRTEVWDWLNKDMIHVIDSKAPRVITMDPWTQKIYLAATGQRTVDSYIKDMVGSFPRGGAPKGIEAFIAEEIRKLVEDEGIVALSENPVRLESHLAEPHTQEGSVEMSGKWQGSYTYGHRTQAAVPFEIFVHEVKGSGFKGTVNDDETKGGTPGTGEITGTIGDDGVTFTKQMPVFTMDDGKGTRIVDAARKHRPIHYAGEFSRSKRHITGTWHFKTGLRWIGWRPYVLGGWGKWQMEKVD
jgi:hypothetical protein